MLKFLVRAFLILPMFYPLQLLASIAYDHYEEDLKLSKTKFIISGVPRDDNQDSSKGVMTLCFKESTARFSFDHPALVFERFYPMKPPEILLRMVHHTGQDVMIESTAQTLRKTYRGIRKSLVSEREEFVPAFYIRYASWIISNDRLVEGLELASYDYEKGKFKNHGTSVKYVQRIMQKVGLQGVDFGFWFATPNNLKVLVDKYVSPKPHFTKERFPKLDFEQQMNVEYIKIHGPQPRHDSYEVPNKEEETDPVHQVDVANVDEYIRIHGTQPRRDPYGAPN